MIKELIAIANDLDSKGHMKEADILDKIIRKTAEDIFEHKNNRENLNRFTPSPYDPDYYTRSDSRRWQVSEIQGAKDILIKSLELSKRLEEEDLTPEQRRGVEMDLDSAIMSLDVYLEDKHLKLKEEGEESDEHPPRWRLAPTVRGGGI